jgi:hypothetical protein
MCKIHIGATALAPGDRRGRGINANNLILIKDRQRRGGIISRQTH